MRTLNLVVLYLALPLATAAQSPVAVPNPMATHTVFIIVVVAAFLAWAASFSLNALRKNSGKTGSKSAMACRDALLDELANREFDRKAGTLSEAGFEKQTRVLRGRLAAVLTKLESTPPGRQKKG